MTFSAILSVALVLFTVIDIPGSLPIILSLKKQGMQVHPGQTTLVSGSLMLLFLFFGTSLLGIFGIEVGSFALAGSLIIFFMGLEMVLGIRFFRDDPHGKAGTLVPLAFPLIAGAGTLTTILSLRSQFDLGTMLLGIALNLGVIFLVLRSSDWVGKKLGETGTQALRKVFGVILIAVAIQMFKNNWGG
ncbi:MAG: MarC family protein [Bacteroidota bacterium]